MSLVGFRAQNHPQQRAKDEVDDRQVRPEDFAPWQARFGFTIDAAASPSNALLPRYWTRETDALAQDWWGERVWCNPPYSNLRPWVEKAWRQWDSCHEAELVVMLLPNNRREQSWWQELVEPHLRARRSDFRDESLPGRMRITKSPTSSAFRSQSTRASTPRAVTSIRINAITSNVYGQDLDSVCGPLLDLGPIERGQ